MPVTDFRLLDTGCIPAAANMALDSIILEEVARGSSPPTIRFLQFKPAAALVGYHQDVNLEVRKDYCAANGIDVNRRLTGGGSILFQESALGWEVFGIPGKEPFGGRFESILHRTCTIAAEAISLLGPAACFRPRNDIEVGGRKISGTGGTAVSGGFMFQGTLLVENEVELFLKALRVPVEKLKKREIESLMERICFLSDLVRPVPTMKRIKETLASEFAQRLGIHLVPAGLTDREEARFQEELPYFSSSKWIAGRSRPEDDSEPVRSITQTDGGTLRVHLWPSTGGKRIRQALIAGDFFTIPGRLIHDLEAALIGARMDQGALRETVETFFANSEGEVLGIEPAKLGEAVEAASERLLLVTNGFTRAEANELFFLNMTLRGFAKETPRWLLLPYCSKEVECSFRKVPGCDECGACEIGDCFELARAFQLEPITVQSFEHLMEILQGPCCSREGVYVGSCCEAFYAKHQQEMKSTNARGVLVNLDSTTCYDLGKYGSAYKGDFENQTFLNLPLIEKTLGHFNGHNRSR